MIISNRSGMALLIVLGISVTLLILGISYLRSFSETPLLNSAQIDRVRADYFARGIQNIALLKIKRYPDYFIRAYRIKNQVGDFAYTTVATKEKYFNSFLSDKDTLTDNGGPLRNNSELIIDKITSYTTDISILSAKDFTENLIEVTVNVETTDGSRKVTTPYKITVDTNQVAR